MKIELYTINDLYKATKVGDKVAHSDDYLRPHRDWMIQNHPGSMHHHVAKASYEQKRDRRGMVTSADEKGVNVKWDDGLTGSYLEHLVRPAEHADQAKKQEWQVGGAHPHSAHRRKVSTVDSPDPTGKEQYRKIASWAHKRALERKMRPKFL